MEGSQKNKIEPARRNPAPAMEAGFELRPTVDSAVPSEEKRKPRIAQICKEASYSPNSKEDAESIPIRFSVMEEGSKLHW